MLCQFLFGLTVVAWVLYLPSIREGGKMQQAQVNAHRFRTSAARFLFHFAGKYHVPVIAFSLDGASFDGSLDLSMQLYFDAAYLGETDSVIVCQGKACLWVGEAIIVASSLIARVAWGISTLATSKERFESFVGFSEHILQYLRMDILVFFPDLFDLRQLVSLIVVSDALAHHTVSITSFL